VRRLFSLLFGLGLLLSFLAWILHPRLLNHFGQRALQRLEERLEQPITVERFEPLGFSALRLTNLRLGDPQAPLLMVRSIQVDLNTEALRRGQVKLEALKVQAPSLHLRGDGSLKDLLRQLRELKEELPFDRFGARGSKGGFSERSAQRPRLELHEGRLLDHGGALLIEGGELRLEGRRYGGRFLIQHPDRGPCKFWGDFERLSLECERAFQEEISGLYLQGQRLDLYRKPELKLRLNGIQLLSSRSERLRALEGLEVDLSLLPRENRPSPLELHLRFPAGGELRAQGEVDRQHLNLSVRLREFKLEEIHARLKGRLSASLRLKLDLPKRNLEAEGELDLRWAYIDHPDLAEEPVGPMELKISGSLAAEPGLISIKQGRLELEGLPLFFEGSLDRRAELPHLRAQLWAEGRVKGVQLSRAIPEGLLPHLQPLQLGGSLRFSSELDLDWAALKKTRLKVNLKMRRLKLLSLNEAIKFDSLRRQFRTQFEMPDGEILAREVGPDTTRWVPLEEIPPLLPEAVIAQEDGGFYKHGGVSLLHIRGSLIRNLREGRFVRGGSTLTMQLARNLFLNRRKTLSRKLEEMLLTWLLEAEFEKEELMALYLNVVEFGPDVFGIREAAMYYFQKAPQALRPREIAFLVRLLPGPRKFHAQFERGKLSPSWRRRVERLLRRLMKRGFLSEEEYAEAKAARLWQEPELLSDDSDAEDLPP